MDTVTESEQLVSGVTDTASVKEQLVSGVTDTVTEQCHGHGHRKGAFSEQ